MLSGLPHSIYSRQSASFASVQQSISSAVSLLAWFLKLCIRPKSLCFTCYIYFSLIRDGKIRREEVAGDWRRLHYEELHNLYTSQNIVRVIKSRRMRWVEHAARM
jgi:hypothetical protein